MVGECKQQIVSFEVKRRTFEGKTDKSKNTELLTSEYMPSYRYVALYRMRRDYGSGNVSVKDESRAFRTKKEAEDYCNSPK